MRKISQENTDRFAEGVRYALEELREIYGEGIEETDVWAEYAEGEGK